MDQTEQFVRASLNGDAVEAGGTFDALMRAKIAGQIDALRAETAARLVGGSGSEEAE